MVRMNENDLAMMGQAGLSWSWLIGWLVGSIVSWLVGHSWLDEND